MPRVEAITMVLNRLPDLKAKSLRGQVLWDVMFAGRGRGLKTEEPKLSDAERKQVLTATLASWQKLMAPMMQPAEDDDEESESAGAMQYAPALEHLVTGMEMGQVYQLQMSLRVLGDEASGLMKSRVTELLKGQVPPPLPSANDVKDDERQALVAEFSKLDGPGIATRAKTLSAAQKLALVPDLMKAAEWPAGLKSFNSTLQQVKVSPKINAAPWKAMEGKAVTADTCIELAKLAARAEDPQVVTIVLARSSPLVGWILNVKVSPKPSSWFAPQMSTATQSVGADLGKLAKRYVQAYAVTSRSQKTWQWTGEPLIPATDGKEATASALDERLAELREEEPDGWKMIRAIFTTDAPTPKTTVGIGFASISTQRILELYPPTKDSN
jgi:hypothetical protein